LKIGRHFVKLLARV